MEKLIWSINPDPNVAVLDTDQGYGFVPLNKQLIVPFFCRVLPDKKYVAFYYEIITGALARELSSTRNFFGYATRYRISQDDMQGLISFSAKVNDHSVLRVTLNNAINSLNISVLPISRMPKIPNY